MALTKEEKESGYRSVPLPPLWAQPILRRIGRGHLLLTMGENGPLASYEDGTQVRIERRKNRVVVHEPMTGSEAADWALRGWLIPIEGESLFEGGPPQRYRARTPSDGSLPRVLGPHGNTFR